MSSRKELERFIVKAKTRYSSQTLEHIDDYLGKEALNKRAQSALINELCATAFAKKVYFAVSEIRPGETASYSEIAEKIGHRGAARAVGTALKNNPYPLLIPCHRVIKSNGDIGSYNGPPGMKAKLLEFERSSEGIRG